MAKVVKVNAIQMTERFKNGLSGAGPRYKEGIESVQDNPCELAANQRSLWEANTIAAAPKWERNLRAVTKEEWKTAALTKGAANLSTSAPLAAVKYGRKAGRLIEALNGAMATLPERGPHIDFSVARVRHMMEKMRDAFAEG